MTSRPANSIDGRSAFSSRSVAWMLGVGTLAFLLLVTLAAFQPELKGRMDPGKHALSRSAVGFHGLTRLLKETGTTVLVSRGAVPKVDGAPGLLIQTPEVGTDMNKPRLDDIQRPRLIVLDKWLTRPDPLRPEWVRKGDLRPPEGPALLARAWKPRDAGPTGKIERRAGVARPVLTGPGVQSPPAVLDPIDRFQTLDGVGGARVVTDEAGRTVLWRLDQNTYVLTEPDLLNNQGLKSPRNARFAVELIDQLRQGGPVIFDVTLNGFTRSRSILRMALGPPFLGATLCALAAALLMGFHAAARFGPVPATERALALGKTALVENSALLIRLARREHRMGGRYAAVVRRAAIKGLALGRETQAGAADAALDRMGPTGEPVFTALVADAERAKTEDQLMQAVRALHRRKLEIVREPI